MVSKTFFVEWVREEIDETDEESLLDAEARNQNPGLKVRPATSEALIISLARAQH